MRRRGVKACFDGCSDSITFIGDLCLVIALLIPISELVYYFGITLTLALLLAGYSTHTSFEAWFDQQKSNKSPHSRHAGLLFDHTRHPDRHA